MKKSLIKVSSAMLIFVILSLTIFSNITAAELPEKTFVDNSMVLQSRFLNMLNHSYVYGENFDNIEDILNNSVIALLDNRDPLDSDYIDEKIVNDYLFNMYGFTISDFSKFNSNFEHKSGYVYILPRGYTMYNHSPISLTENDDGTFLFITEVEITTHDRLTETLSAKTLFVKNSDSVFGYNIINSELL